MRFAKIILGITIIGLFIITLFSYAAFDDDIHYKTGSFSDELESSIESKSVVAIFNCNNCKFGLERIKTIDRFKYLFYSPTSYSDGYYINPNQIKKCKLSDCIILFNQDTLYDNGKILSITSIPENLTLITGNNKMISAKLLNRLDDNIKTKPKISLFDKLSLGPLFE